MNTASLQCDELKLLKKIILTAEVAKQEEQPV